MARVGGIRGIGLLAIVVFNCCFFFSHATLIDGELYQLDAKNIQRSVLNSNESWLVVYTGGPEQNLDTFLDGVAREVRNYGISVGKIDCSKDTKLCRTEGVTKIPTLKLFKGKPEINPYTGKLMRSPETFSIDRLDMRAVTKLISKSYPASLVSKINSLEELDSLNALYPEISTVVLFSDKPVVSVLLRSIAELFKGRLHFVSVSIKSSPEIGERYDVSSTTIGVLKPNSATLIKIDGVDMESRASVVSWLSSFATNAPNSTIDSKDPKIDYSHRHSEEEYTSDKFDLNALSTESAWMVAVVGEGAELPAQWSGAQRGCVGHIECAVLRCQKGDLSATADIDAIGDSSLETATLTFGQQACRQGTAALPFLLTIRHGAAERKKLLSPKVKWNTAIMELSEHDKAAKRLGDSLPNSAVAGMYENMLPQFVSMGLEKGLFTLLLLSDSSDVPALWKNAALTYSKVVQFGFVSGPSAQFVKDTNVVKLPSVLAVLPPSPGDIQEDPEKQGQGMRVINYDHKALGPVRFESLHVFINALLREWNMTGPKQEAPADDVMQSSQTEVITLKSEADWTEHCGESFRGICAVGLLSPSTSGAALEGADIIMTSMIGLGKSAASFRFMLIDAACHPEFAESFGIHSHELPTLVIYSPSKRRYQTLKGSFSGTSIKDLTLSIISGRSSTVPMSTRPIVAAECAAALTDSAGEEAFQDTAESSEDAEEFLREIQREEAAKAAQLKAEVKEEQLRIFEESKKKTKKTNKKKKKKAKSKKTEL